MKKRVLFAVALVIAMVLIAQTGAWAGKLASGNEAPSAGPAEIAGARPHGTGGGTGGEAGALPFVPPASPTSDQLLPYFEDYIGDPLVGTATTLPDGASFYEVTCKADDQDPVNPLSDDCALYVEDGTDVKVDGAQSTIPRGSYWYWDGSDWVALTIGIDGYVWVPEGAPNPFILAILEE